MTREDIIRMAREAGFRPDPGLGVFHKCDGGHLERFAALVAAHIRETEFKPDWNNYRQGLADGAAEEREACAKVCADLHIEGEDDTGLAADLIRARGQA